MTNTKLIKILIMIKYYILYTNLIMLFVYKNLKNK